MLLTGTVSGAIRVKINVEGGTVLENILNQYHKTSCRILQLSDLVSPPIIKSSPSDNSKDVFGTKHGLHFLMGLQIFSSI